MLSQFLEDRYPLELVGDRAEGVGYLLKERVGDLQLFADSVRRVAAGGTALDPQVVQRMVGRRRENSPLDELTPREREVMALMAEGRSNAGIAAELVVTVPAVERHVTGIFDKLGLRQAPEDHRRVLAVLGTSSERDDPPGHPSRCHRSHARRGGRAAREGPRGGAEQLARFGDAARERAFGRATPGLKSGGGAPTAEWGEPHGPLEWPQRRA